MALTIGSGRNVDVRPESTWGQVFTTEGEIMARKTGTRNLVLVDDYTVILNVDDMVKKLNDDYLGDVNALAKGIDVDVSSLYRILRANEYRRTIWAKDTDAPPGTETSDA